jgi:60 kDa SS-A/Ro ribonucleoprotein
LPLAQANRNFRHRKLAGCILVSDTESWVYRGQVSGVGQNGSSGVMTEWQEFVKNQVRLLDGDQAGPRLVCINLQPYATSQASERSDILNIGGFSDAVFNVVASFLRDDADRFVSEVKAVEL